MSQAKVELENMILAAMNENRDVMGVEANGEYHELYLEEKDKLFCTFYRDILDEMLSFLERAERIGELDSLRVIFEEAQVCDDDSKRKACREKLNQLIKPVEMRQKFSLFKSEIQDMPEGKSLIALTQAFEEKKEELSTLKRALEEEKAKPGVRIYPFELRSPELQSLFKACEDAKKELNNIAEKLGQAHRNYTQKMQERLPSARHDDISLLLKKWGDHIESSKKIGWIDYCSVGMGKILTRMFTAIKRLILEISALRSSYATEKDDKMPSDRDRLKINELLSDFCNTEFDDKEPASLRKE